MVLPLRLTVRSLTRTIRGDLKPRRVSPQSLVISTGSYIRRTDTFFIPQVILSHVDAISCLSKANFSKVEGKSLHWELNPETPVIILAATKKGGI